MSALIDNGQLTIPLHHGTSSLFIEGINSSGLGGKNPIEDLKVLPTLGELIELADTHLSTDSEWLSSRWVFKNYAAQKMTPSANWQHGHVYFSPERTTAIRYATNNKYGSELISDTIKLNNRLGAHALTDKDLHPVLSVTAVTAYPVLVTVEKMPVAFLASEKDQDIDSLLSFIEKGLSDVVHRLLWQQMNFRIIQPLSPQLLQIEAIETRCDPRS